MEMIYHSTIKTINKKILLSKTKKDLDSIQNVDIFYDSLSLALPRIKNSKKNMMHFAFAEKEIKRVIDSKNQVFYLLQDLDNIYEHHFLSIEQMRQALAITIALQGLEIKEDILEYYRNVFLKPIRTNIPITFLSLVIDTLYYDLYLDNFDGIFSVTLEGNENLQNFLSNILNHDLYGRELSIQTDGIDIPVILPDGDRDSESLITAILNQKQAGKDTYSYLIFLYLAGYFSEESKERIKNHFQESKNIDEEYFDFLVEEYRKNLF